MSRLRPRPQRQDSGASLILVIGFVLMVSAIGGGLASFATTSLNNRNTLELVRNRQYAADGAIEEAISKVRSLPATYLPSSCIGTGTMQDQTFSVGTIRVDWVNACGVIASTDGTVVPQRNVIFSACLTTGPSCGANIVLIRAQVTFQQASNGVVTKTYVQSWSFNQ